ncbi:lysozyme inhibitor LprI family protein [Mesorhizobium opportunistum]|uniref:lysozyme inhibitor LprI family protein n=1 Tax=Mesorhizobium opportunistum TaxID=593909 RepID=UPI003335E3B4
MIELIVAASLLIGGVVGYFGKRFIEGSARGEQIDRVTKIVDLKAKMDASGMELQDVSDFESRVLFSKPRLRQLEDAVEKVVDPETPPEVTERLAQNFQIEGRMTQAEMTQSAYSSMKGAEALLEMVFGELREELPKDKFKSLKATQDAWVKYAHGQATLVASLAEGGSMQPMLYSSERERLTSQRYAELRDYRDSRRL